MRIRSAVFAAALLTLYAAGQGTATAAIPPSRTTTTGPDHIVVMVFENREADAIMSPTSSAPYFRSRIRAFPTTSR